MSVAEFLEMELANRIFSVSGCARTVFDCKDHAAEKPHFILIECEDCKWQ